MIFLERYSGDGDPPRLHWKRRGLSRFKVLLTCPSGHVRVLLKSTVGADGRVEPSVRCSLCEWHEWVQLRGWA